MARTSVVGARMRGADGEGWLFDPGALSLEFAYTGDFGYGVAEWESLHERADLARWLEERFTATGPIDDDTFAQALRLRSALWSVARARVDGGAPDPVAVDAINDVGSRPDLPPVLSGGVRELPRTDPGQQLSTIARDAIRTLSSPTGRLKRCAADDCHLIFLDTSRPGSRRWCSMSRCGGRSKARAHHERHRNEN